MASEFYIRSNENEDPRGPFTLEKLISLGEAGQVTHLTLVYDETTEAWIPLETKEDLYRQVFPQQRKLALKQKSAEDMKLLNTPAEAAGESVTVTKMLSAAEGDTPETRHFRKKKEWEERSAALMVPGLTLAMVLSALTYLVPGIPQLQSASASGDYLSLLQHPLLLVGFVDAFIALSLALAYTDIYDFLRFRVMVGFGYFGLYYWAMWTNSGDTLPFYLMVSTIAGGFGVYLATLSLNIVFVAIGLTLGIGGVAAYGFFAAWDAFRPFFEGFLGGAAATPPTPAP